MRSAKIAVPLVVGMVLLVALVAILRTRNPGLTLTFTADDLQQKLAGRFPLREKLPFTTITFRDPRVVLADGSDRIGLRITADATAAGGKELSGSLLLDGALRYEPQEGAFYFDGARVQEMAVQGLSDDARRQIQTVASLLINLYLSHVPVYRLNPEDIRQALAKTFLKSVSVRNGRLIVEIGIAS